MSTVTLAYHRSAEGEAATLSSHLGTCGYRVESLICSGSESPLAPRLLAVEGALLLLVNDPFLHSIDCQLGMLDAYRQLDERRGFHPVLASAQRQGPSGEQVRLLTSLSRVSDVIRYMNFWQNAYLNLRKELAGSPGEAGKPQLTGVRRISQEIGEVLRLIRARKPTDVLSLGGAAPQVLSRMLGEPSLAKVSSVSAVSAIAQMDTANDSSSPASLSGGAVAHDSDFSNGGDLLEPSHDTPRETQADEDVATPSAVIAVPVSTSHAPDGAPGITEVSSSSTEASHANVAEASAEERSPSTDTTTPTPALLKEPAESGERPAGVDEALPQDFYRSEEQGHAPAEGPSPGQAFSADAPQRDTVENSAAEDYEIAPPTHSGDNSLVLDRTASTTDQKELAALAIEAQETTRTRNMQIYLTHREQGDVEEGLEYARASLAGDPADYRMRYALAVGLLEGVEEDDRHLEEAVVVMRDLFDSPLAAQAHLCLGQIAIRLRDYGSARRHFRKAYRLNKRVDPELTYRLGALLQDEFEQPQKAARYLRIATRRSRKNTADAHYRIGLLELAEDKLRRGIRHFKLALQHEDDHPFAAYELAVTYLLRDRPLRALSYFQRAVRANPELDTEANRQAFTPVDADGAPTRLPETTADKFFGFVRGMHPADDRNEGLLDMREIGPIEAPEAKQVRHRPRAELARAQAPTPSDVSAAADVYSAQTPMEAQKPRRPTLTVLITGASSGIGEATARRFATEGHRLILTGRRVDKLRSLSDELKGAHGTEIRLLSYDVADFGATRKMIDNLGSEWSTVDLLINNAGKALGLKPVYEATPEEIDGMVDTNVKGLLYMIRLVAPGMVERRSGHIINVCSTAGHEVYAGGTIYCATKHAVDAITRGARLDLFRHNIRVSQVSPAAVEGTEFSKVRFEGDAARAAAVYEGFQPLHAADVAEALYSIATAPAHVNIQDVIVLSTQQGNSTSVERSGRK